MSQKLLHFFARTDAQMHGQKLITSLPLHIFLHICEGEGGKLSEPYQISTSSLGEV